MPDVPEIVLRLFLSAIFASSAIGKLRRDWLSELRQYRLWPEGWAPLLAAGVVGAECVLVGTLILAPAGGLTLAGIVLLAFGHTQVVARSRKYTGACGCSAAGLVSPISSIRAYMWGSAALWIGLDGWPWSNALWALAAGWGGTALAVGASIGRRHALRKAGRQSRDAIRHVHTVASRYRSYSSGSATEQ